MKKLSLPLAVLAGLGFLVGGCSSNTRGDDAAPVYITCDFTLLPAAKNVNDGSLMQFQTVTLQNRLKSPTAAASSFLDVQLETYTIVWTRIDGGKTASKTESFGGNSIVPVGGNTTLSNYPFMSISALQQPPLSFLFPYNGGVDPETGRSEIRQTGTVTFNGHTMSGQPVASVPAPFDMTFVYIAAAGRIEAARGR
jgi:hypothetical protein